MWWWCVYRKPETLGRVIVAGNRAAGWGGLVQCQTLGLVGLNDDWVGGLQEKRLNLPIVLLDRHETAKCGQGLQDANHGQARRAMKRRNREARAYQLPWCDVLGVAVVVVVVEEGCKVWSLRVLAESREMIGRRRIEGEEDSKKKEKEKKKRRGGELERWMKVDDEELLARWRRARGGCSQR